MQEVPTNPGDADEFKLLKNGYRGYLHHYRESLSLLYAKAENYQLRLERWKVSKIRIYKDKGTLVKHEYLVATLCDPDGHERDLRMERRVDSSAMNFITESLGVVGSASTRAVAADVAAPGGAQEKDEKFRKWAVDEISLCSSDTFDDAQLQVDHFRFQDGHPVSLPQLVVLACAISEYCATYHVAWSNCYWFCYVASKALKKRFDHTLEPVGDSSQLGCWHGIPLCLRSNIEEVVTEVLEIYDKTWTAFRSEIDQIVNNPHNENTKEAEQEAARQKIRADQERARADKEEQKRKDLECEVIELRALLERKKLPVEQGA